MTSVCNTATQQQLLDLDREDWETIREALIVAEAAAPRKHARFLRELISDIRTNILDQIPETTDAK